MTTTNDPGAVIAITVFIIFLFCGGWALIGWGLVMIIGSLFGYPAWWIRLLIRKATGYDFVKDMPDMHEDDGLISHAILGVFMGAIISITVFVITHWLSGFIIGVTILALLFFSGEISFWILSKILRFKSNPSAVVTAIFGNVALFCICFIGYYLVIALKDIYLLIKDII
jgi:hypothetical protein